MATRDHSDVLRRFDALQTRAFDKLAKFVGNKVVFDGRKVTGVASLITSEYIHELVGYLPKRWSDLELTRQAFKKLGCEKENYVALDDVVLRIVKISGDLLNDQFIHLTLHSTPNQPAASTQEEGSINLAIGQQVVPLTFRVVDPKADYVFTFLDIENAIDAAPLLDLDITPGARTTTGRTLHLNGAPDTVNYVLRYKIIT
ncbi:MAG: hypothetical protein V7609_2089 [Verrucomicrobiota bacterium]